MKTAYSRSMTDEEFAESTKGLPAEDCEEMRVERITNPLFDMWLRFEDAFAKRAIDCLDISDVDAETAAKKMEGISSSGDAFAHLLRHITMQRELRRLFHKVSAVWAASGTNEGLSPKEIHARYAKLPKGDA